jgi:hypothetical protein
MQSLSRLPGVTKGELKKANLCRKRMKVITIAELASIDGKCIPAICFNGQWRARSNLRWPHQPAPMKGMWDIFRRLVKQAFCSQYKQTPLRLNVWSLRDAANGSPPGGEAESTRTIGNNLQATNAYSVAELPTPLLLAAHCSSLGWILDKISWRTIVAKTGEVGQPCENPSLTSMMTHDPSSFLTKVLPLPS